MLVVGTLVWVLVDAFGSDKVALKAPVRTEQIGDLVFRGYLIPFEVVGVLLRKTPCSLLRS